MNCFLMRFSRCLFSMIPARLPFQSQNTMFLTKVMEMNQQDVKPRYQQHLNDLRTRANKAQLKLYQSQNACLYQQICSSILTENDYTVQSQFIQHAHYYFQAQGKKVRPLMINLIASSCLQTWKQEHHAAVKLWSALIQILHIASLAHDDVIDDSPSRRGLKSQHLAQGKRRAVFSGNYIISKASKKLYDLRSSRFYEIYSLAMQNLADGQVLQALNKGKIANKADILLNLQSYMTKTYLKTGALIANALRAVPLLLMPQSDDKQVIAFHAGQHFGLAFQIVDDILDFIGQPSKLGKETLQDFKSGNFTAPFFLALHGNKTSLGSLTLQKQLNELSIENKRKERAEEIKGYVIDKGGIQRSYLLAAYHVEQGLKMVTQLGSCASGAWAQLSLLLLERQK